MNDSANYLLFLNSLNIEVPFVEVLKIEPHQTQNLSGWRGLKSIVTLNQNEELYDIDIRYAWSSEIFQQYLIDCGWSETTLLTSKLENKPIRHKLVLYLCAETIKIEVSKLTVVPERFVIGSYWQSVSHFYLSSLAEHPFCSDIPREQTTPINSTNYHKFSTLDKPADNSKIRDSLHQSLFLPPHPQRQGEGGLRVKGLRKNFRDNLPLVSIITVVFNGEKYLEQTIQSIINSSYPNLEYIVIDGASQDNSLSIIKKYEDYIDYWVSEPDKGIYDAMNKGTIVSSGSHTLHINADDLIYDFQALEKRIKESLAKKKDLYSLNLLSSIFFYRLEAGELVKKTPIQPHKDRNMNILKVPVGHQGFIGLKNSISIFDTSYQITAARGVIANKTSQEKIDLSPTPIAICRSGGVSYGFNQKKSAEIKRAISNSESILVYASLLLSNIYITLLKLAQITGLTKIKKRILR